MKEKGKSRGRKPQICSLKGGRVLLNARPTSVPPLLAALVLLKDDQIPSADYGPMGKSTSQTVLRIATFLTAVKALKRKRKGEEA